MTESESSRPRSNPAPSGGGSSTLIGAMILGALIFGGILGVLFGITGISLFGFSGIFGIVAGITLGLFGGAILGLLSYLGNSQINPASSRLVKIAFLAVVGGVIGFFINGAIVALVGTVIGAGIGIGLYFGLGEDKAHEIISSILTILVLAVLAWLTFVWVSSGAIAVLVSPLGINIEQIQISITKGVKCINDPITCLFKPFYDWSDPNVVEKKIEEVSVRVDLSKTNTLFFEGEDIIIKSTVTVLNPFHPDYILEPSCYLNDEQIDLRETPRLENGEIHFGKSDIEQRVTVICEKKGGLDVSDTIDWESTNDILSDNLPDDIKESDVRSVPFELRIVKATFARTEWNVYTLHKSVLEETAEPFLTIVEPNRRGRTILSKMEFSSPLKLSLGIDDDQPLTEGKWPFSIVLRKKEALGELQSIRSLYLENPSSPIVKISQPCQLGGTFSQYSLSAGQLSKITQVLNERDTSFEIHCSLDVAGLDARKNVPEKTVIKAFAEFDYEQIHKIPITILKGLRRETFDET